MSERPPKAPGLRQLVPLPFGTLGSLIRDPLGFQIRARERFGDIFRLRLGPLLVHFVYHPDYVTRVLVDRQKNYLRGWQYGFLRRQLGENLVVSDGEYWRRQRRLAQPAFHHRRLVGYGEIMLDAVGGMLSPWRASRGEAIDVAPALSRLALSIAGRTLFSRDIGHEADEVGRAFAVLANYLESRLNRPFTNPPPWAPTPGNLRFKRATRVLHRIVSEIIARRRRESEDCGDLLSMLMQARDEESGASMSDAQLRSEVLTFLIAGHETTATAMTWACYLLASHPSIQQRVRDEIAEATGDRLPGVADLPALTFTRTVIEESLRLYPPVWLLPRQAEEEDEIGGYRIPARSTVVVCQYATHRHPDIWPEPDRFDPDRFSEERRKEIPNGAFFPFLGGPHLCIGKEFAMMEMRLVLATLLREFTLGLASDEPIGPRASIVLRPDQPVRLLLKRDPVTG